MTWGRGIQEVQPLVFENHYALPRFFPVYHWENLLPQDDPLVRLKNIDPGKTALIEEESPFPPRPPAGAESPANITVTHYEPQDISLSVTMPREGLLVLGEIYYPGWKVWIDGRPGKIYRVDHILRGVFLSPGEHQASVAISKSGSHHRDDDHPFHVSGRCGGSLLVRATFFA